jgi:hypothetical protein
LVTKFSSIKIPGKKSGIIGIICLLLAIGFSACQNDGVIPSQIPQPSQIISTLTPSATSSIPATTDLDSVQPGSTLSATPEPVPFLLEQPGDPTLTPWPTNIFTPSLGPSPTRTPTHTETPTITPTPTPPLAVLRIFRPGLLSKVISPIKVEAMVTPGDDGMVYFDLIGEDSRLINHFEMNLRYNLDQHLIITPRIDFQISAVAETARLVMYIRDTDGRIVFLSSVDLVLLSLGENAINLLPDQQEPFLIRAPHPGSTINGGIVHLVGLVRPASSRPLIIEMTDEKRNLIGSAEILISFPQSPLSHTPFEIDIPYVIKQEKTVRLSLRQESDQRIPGNVSIYSFLLNLQP